MVDEAEGTGMKWTTERPTKQGYYWFRDENGITKIVRIGPSMFVHDESEDSVSLEELYSGIHPSFLQWAGPIPEPEFA